LPSSVTYLLDLQQWRSNIPNGNVSMKTYNLKNFTNQLTDADIDSLMPASMRMTKPLSTIA